MTQDVCHCKRHSAREQEVNVWRRWFQPWQRQGAWAQQERLSGLGSPVEVRTDRWGIRHLLTRREEDLFRAQGYCTAQDRLFQMDMMRRMASGRLAALYGDIAVAGWEPALHLRGQGLASADYLMRSLGLHEAAHEGMSWISPRTYRALRAYAEGVNEWIAQMRRNQALPTPYTLLQSEPEAWEATDSLLVLRMLGLQLSFSWRLLTVFGAICERLAEEQARLESFLPPHLSLTLGLGYLKKGFSDLFPPKAAAQETTTTQAPAARAEDALSGLVPHPLAPEGTGQGSCAWVVSGQHTQSGLPLLANDPHLQLRLPNSFYQIRLWGGEYNVIGLSIPGVPGIFAGYNNEIAWGATLQRVDDADLCMERLDQTGERYLYQDRYLPMIRREEVIRVRDEAPRIRWVRSTLHGVLLSDALRGPLPSESHYALRWTGQEGVREAEALLQLNRAQDWSSFLEGLRYARVPALGYVYADRRGNIGAALAGHCPQRPAAPRRFRPLASHEWSEAWQGEIPFDALPRSFNPAKGYLILSGQAPEAPLEGVAPKGFWEIGSRLQRIESLLQRSIGQKKLGVEEMARLQRDTYCLWSRDFIQRTLKPFQLRTRLTGAAREQLNLLLDWNGRAGQESIATTFFAAFQYQLLDTLLKPTLGDDLFRRWLDVAHELEPPIEAVLRRDDLWMKRSRDDAFHDAMQLAYRFLEERLGSDPQRWRWGLLHQLTLRPLFLRDTHHLATWQRGPFPTGGAALSINTGSFHWNRPFEQRIGAAARQIIDLQQPDASVWVLCGGQSEDAEKNHYDDQLVVWLQGDHLPMPHSTTSLQSLRPSWLLPEDQDAPPKPLLHPSASSSPSDRPFDTSSTKRN